MRGRRQTSPIEKPGAGFPIVVSAPSGTGKTSICRRLARGMKGVSYSVSATTRKPRRGERSGRDYVFLSEKRFRQLVSAGKFAEWAKVYGSFYGTPKKWLEDRLKKGQCVVLALDHNGAERIRKKYRGAVLVFLLPPSIRELRRRLEGRKTDSASSVKARLEAARKELAFARDYDYWVVNRRLEKTVQVLGSIITAEGQRRERLGRIIMR